MKKPKGRQGSWFAEWNGELLPCVHERWTSKRWPHYLDPNVDDRPEWPTFVAAIRDGARVILTSSLIPSQEGEPWRRKSYIALWRVADVEVADGNLMFKFAEQLHRFQ